MKQIIFVVILAIGMLIITMLLGILLFVDNKDVENSNGTVNNFEECALAGYNVMESYPRQCRTSEGELFVENIGNELEKADLIRIDNPRPNQTISSPLLIKGTARGYWFFEGDFPVILTNWDGLIIAEGFASAKGEWMTEDFVAFEATLEFEIPEYKNNGSLILRKDNPSGLPENDDALEIPVMFEKDNNTGILPFDSGVNDFD